MFQAQPSSHCKHYKTSFALNDGSSPRILVFLTFTDRLVFSLCDLRFDRMRNFEKGDDYKQTWSGNEDGKVSSSQPMRIEDSRDGIAGNSTYITRSFFTNINVDNNILAILALHVE